MALMSAEEFFYGKKVLARNVLLNLLGLSLPLIIGFFSMPLILAGLGKERFGLLSLTWMILGYVSVFDLGLGRATTRYIAFALSQGEKDQIPSIFWTTVIAQFLLGLIGSLLIFSLTPIIVDEALKIPLWLSAEARTAFFLLSLVVPLVLVFGSLSGLLEVWQRFDLINAVKIPLSSINFILAALSYFWPLSIVDIVLAVFFCRLLGAGLLFFFGCRQVPELTKKIIFKKRLFPRLLSYGGWITVSNIVGPFLVYFERFLIGAWLSLEAVSYYTAPYEVITRFWILPTSLVLTLFPVFSTWQQERQEKIVELFFQATKFLFLLLAPVILLLCLLARVIFRIWLGPDFMAESSLVFQILAWGVLVNSLAQIPLALLQGMERPDLPAKFHLGEVPFYVAVAWLLVHHWGIEGAALAWTLRVTLDALLLFGAVSRKIPSFFALFKQSQGIAMGLCFLLITMIDYIFKAVIKADNLSLIHLIFWIGSIIIFFYFSWKHWLLRSEKEFLAQFFQQFKLKL